MKRPPQHVTGGYLGSSYSEGNADRTSLGVWQSDLKFGKIVGGVVTITTRWRWRYDRGGGEIDMNWKELFFLPYLMLGIIRRDLEWNIYPWGKIAKKAIFPQAKVTKKAMLKPCNNQTNPTLPYPNAIKYLPLVQICQKKAPIPPILILKEHPWTKTNSKFNLRRPAILLQLLPKLPLPFSKELFRPLPLSSLCSWTSLSTSFSITSPPILKEGTVSTSFQLKLISISPPRSWCHRQSIAIVTTPTTILPNFKSLCQPPRLVRSAFPSGYELPRYPPVTCWGGRFIFFQSLTCETP